MIDPEKIHRALELAAGTGSGSPTFVAIFADGEITRMTTWCAPGELDVVRGMKLAQHAYRSRMEQEPPAITSARFESNGKTLKTLPRNSKETGQEIDHGSWPKPVPRKKKMPGHEGPGKLKVHLHEACTNAGASAQEF